MLTQLRAVSLSTELGGSIHGAVSVGSAFIILRGCTCQHCMGLPCKTVQCTFCPPLQPLTEKVLLFRPQTNQNYMRQLLSCYNLQ